MRLRALDSADAEPGRAESGEIGDSTWCSSARAELIESGIVGVPWRGGGCWSMAERMGSLCVVGVGGEGEGR